jgi:hypothetical protein
VNRQPFGIGLKGRSTVLISKDRPGQLRPYGLPSTGGLLSYGDLVMDSRDQDHARITIWPPKEKDDTPERPTHLMAKIVELLAAKGALTRRKILAGVKGKTDHKRDALDLLILDGYVSDKTPTRVDQALAGAEDMTNRSPGSPTVPQRSPGTPVAPVPPSIGNGNGEQAQEAEIQRQSVPNHTAAAVGGVVIEETNP